jgi:hypothetical protein
VDDSAIEIYPHWSCLPPHFQQLPRPKPNHRVQPKDERDIPITVLVSTIFYHPYYFFCLIAGYGFGRGPLASPAQGAESMFVDGIRNSSASGVQKSQDNFVRLRNHTENGCSRTFIVLSARERAHRKPSGLSRLPLQNDLLAQRSNLLSHRYPRGTQFAF